MTARKLAAAESKPKTFTFGVVGTGDPRIDQASRDRAANIVKTIADLVKHRAWSWTRFHRLARRWIPKARILHPYANQRQIVRHPR